MFVISNSLRRQKMQSRISLFLFCLLPSDKKGRNKGFVRNQVAVMWLNKHEIESLMNERWRRKSKVKGNDIYVLEFPNHESRLENCCHNLKSKDEQHFYRKKGRSCLAEKWEKVFQCDSMMFLQNTWWNMQTFYWLLIHTWKFTMIFVL